MDAFLVDDDAFDEFGLIGCAADDGFDLDVVCVDAAVVVDDGLCGANDEFGEDVLGGLRALAGHRGRGDLFEGLRVVGVDVDGVVFENFLSLLCGLAVSLGQDAGVDVLVEEFLGLREEFAGHDDRRGRAVAHFVFLGLGDLDNHVGGGVLDVHLVEDGDAVVRDDD